MTTITTPVDSFLTSICGEHGQAIWADDAVLDAVVPGWRLSVEGANAIDAQFRKWFAHPGTLEEVRCRAVDGGEIVELTVNWVEDGVPHAARQIHVLDIENGRITRDAMWCGGRWSAQLLAEMEAARNAG